MINVTDLRSGAAFKDQGNLWEVLEYQHIKVGRGSANIKVKVRNLRSGTITEKSFMSGARVDPAEVEKKEAQFLYLDGSLAYFMDPKSYEQFSLPLSALVGQEKYLQEGGNYNLVCVDEEILSVEMPRTVELKVEDTGPGIKGDSVSSAYKAATLENGMTVQVPLFIKEGEKIRLDTRSGDYLERAK